MLVLLNVLDKTVSDLNQKIIVQYKILFQYSFIVIHQNSLKYVVTYIHHAY